MKSKAAKVYFPCVHSSDMGEMIQITCFEAEELKGTVKALSGIEEVAAANIIGASRHGENNSAAAKGVMATVSNPNFSGRSYGLALAIADKLARYEKCPNVKRVFATGRIEPDGCGKVSSIDELDKKFQLVISRIKEGDLFVFPDQPGETNGPIRQDSLNKLKAKGARWKTVSSIDQLQGIVWRSMPEKKGLLARPIPTKWLKSGVIGLAIMFLLGIFYYQSNLNEPASPIAAGIDASADTDSVAVTEHPSIEKNNLNGVKTVNPVSVSTKAY